MLGLAVSEPRQHEQRLSHDHKRLLCGSVGRHYSPEFGGRVCQLEIPNVQVARSRTTRAVHLHTLPRLDLYRLQEARSKPCLLRKVQRKPEKMVIFFKGNVFFGAKLRFALLAPARYGNKEPKRSEANRKKVKSAKLSFA